MFDSHLHTPLCHHATGAPLEYATQAVHIGLRGICFTEHMPLPNDADSEVRLTKSSLLAYRDMVKGTRILCNNDLEVRCGLEMDFIPGIEAFTKDLLNSFQWDYIIGSVHRVGKMAYGIAPEPADLQSYWIDYYKLVIAAAQSGLYDSIGHLDLPRRWTDAPDQHLEMILPVLDTISQHGLALDFNTSGLRGKLGAAHPPLEFLRLAHLRDIPLVLGSDAHSPDAVASHFDQALCLAREAGYSQVVSFNNRVAEPESIIDMVWG